MDEEKVEEREEEFPVACWYHYSNNKQNMRELYGGVMAIVEYAFVTQKISNAEDTYRATFILKCRYELNNFNQPASQNS